MTTELVDSARASIEAFNRADWAAVRALARSDYVYEETGTGRRFSGIDEVIGAFVGWKAMAPDGVGEVERAIGNGDVVALEIRWRGTHTGPLVTPAGEVPPTGRGFDLWATAWQQWEGGRLVYQRHHLDMLTFLTQLGLVPA